jgi:hypothetical protein
MPDCSILRNPLVIGPLGSSGGGRFRRYRGRPLERRRPARRAAELAMLVTPALTLAVLLSIDTLKTCVVLDALTRSRHDSNRELIGQGLGNIASGRDRRHARRRHHGRHAGEHVERRLTRYSGFIEGVLALVAFLLLGNADLLGAGRRAGRDPDRGRRAHDRPPQLRLPQAAFHHPRLRRDRRGGGHGADGEPDRGLGCRHRAGRGAVHPRADRRFRGAPQAAGQRDLLQAHPHPRGNGNPDRARQPRRDHRTAGQPVLRHRRPALSQPGAGTQGARLPDPRHAPDPDRGRHRRAPAGAGQGHDGRAQGLPDLQPDSAQPAVGARPAAVLRPGRPDSRRQRRCASFPPSTTRWSGSRTASSTRRNCLRDEETALELHEVELFAGRKEQTWPRSNSAWKSATSRPATASSRAAMPATNCS